MIRVSEASEGICNCCDNDSNILIDFTEDSKFQKLGTTLYLCEGCKEKLIDILLPF